MSNNRRVYLLDPQAIPPETIAVAFAKTSRSPSSFDEIASELTRESSSEFHEKWVVCYGHSSVAEHAVLHIALENISRLAIESVESNRLASYTEKSTRYQKWNPDQFFIPSEFSSSGLAELYQSTCRQLLDTYQQILGPVKSVIEAEQPRKPGEGEGAWDRRIRSDYVDVCRFLLPAASLANVGVTINARTLEHALRKMLSHPLSEVQEIGREIKNTALESVPTLLKYVEQVPYLVQLNQNFKQESQKVIPLEIDGGKWCRLVDYDRDGLTKVLAAVLYRFGDSDYTSCLGYVKSCSETDQGRLLTILQENMDEHVQPVRELEYASYLFDLILDQGAFFELKRHRMMTLTPQRLSADLGYAVPKAITQAGQEIAYRQAMDNARRTYQILAEYNPEAAAYIVPNGFNRQALININLRSAVHLLNLRTAPNAHFSIRRVAQKMAEEMLKVFPSLASILCINREESWLDLEKKYFSQTR